MENYDPEMSVPPFAGWHSSPVRLPEECDREAWVLERLHTLELEILSGKAGLQKLLCVRV